MTYGINYGKQRKGGIVPTYYHIVVCEFLPVWIASQSIADNSVESSVFFFRLGHSYEGGLGLEIGVTDRQTWTRTDRHGPGQTETQKHRQTDRQAHRHTADR